MIYSGCANTDDIHDTALSGGPGSFFGSDCVPPEGRRIPSFDRTVSPIVGPLIYPEHLCFWLSTEDTGFLRVSYLQQPGT